MWIGRSGTRTAKAAGIAAALGVSFGFVSVVVALAHAGYMYAPAGIEPRDYVTLGRRETDSGMFAELSSTDYRNLSALTPSMDWAYFRYWVQPVSLTRPDDGASTQIRVRSVSANYLELLGVKPLLGSMTSVPNQSENAAVIGEDLWRRFYGASPDVLGSLLVLEGEDAGRASVVVGVAAGGFVGAVGGDRVDAWKLDAPRGTAPLQYAEFIYLLGVPSGSGDASVQALASLLAPYRFEPPVGGFAPQATVNDRVELVPGIEILPDQRRNTHDRLAWLAWLVALLLVMSFTTLVDFLLAEHRRSRDAQAIRVALGAAPLDVFRRDIATNSLWIVATAAVNMAVFGYVSDLVLAMEPFASYIGELPHSSVVAGLGISTVVLALIFAGAAAKVSREVAEGSAMPFRHRGLDSDASGRRLLLFVAAANLLLVLSLVARHWADARLALPFNHDDALMLQILDAPPGAAQAALTANPEVLSASATEMLPLLAETVQGRNRMAVTGRKGLEGVTVYQNAVDVPFFATLGLEFLAGRSFGGVSPSEAVVSRAAATRLFGDDPNDALGQPLRLSPAPGQDSQEPPAQLTIMGVVEDLPYQASLHATRFVVYSPGPDLPHDEERWLVRHTGSEAALIESIDRLGGEVFRVGTIREIFREQFLARRSVEALLAFAAAFAALLAVAGVAGSLAKWIAGSGRSVGIRLGVGATLAHLTLLYVGRVVPDLVVAGTVLCAAAVAAKWASPALGPMIDLGFLPAAVLGLAATTVLVVFLLLRQMARSPSVDELVEGR